MKMKNEDKVLIGVGLVGLGTIGFFYWKKKKKEKEEALQMNDVTEPLAVQATPISPTPITGAILNKSITLSKGSKGLEVRELQRLLGIRVDGDFGNKTLTALQNKKGVSQISLNRYVISKTVAPKKAVPNAFATPKFGQKLMANANTVSLFNAKKTASGTYFNDGTKPFTGGSYEYGEHLGTFVAEKAGGQYLINSNGTYYFVNRNAVKTY